MEAIELVMKIWGIDEEDRVELEQVLRDTSPKQLGLALLNLGATNEKSAAATDRWMAAYLPELQFGGAEK